LPTGAVHNHQEDMMRSILTCRLAAVALVAVAMTLPAIAAPPKAAPKAAAGAQDGKAILTKMEAAMRQALTTSKSYQATVTKVTREPGGVSSAYIKLKLIPGKKVMAEVTTTPAASKTTKSVPQRVLASDDGAVVTIYIPAKKQAMRQASSPQASIMFVLSQTGLQSNLGSSLRIASAVITGSTVVAGKPAYVVTLTPMKPGMGGLQPTIFTIDKASYRLRKVMVKSPTVPSTIVVSNETLDKPIPASAFKIAIPAGVKISDKRPGAAPGGPTKRK
jgi:outer membrane lipoprotein-sorting protein